MKKVLVSGGAGYIGAHTAFELSEAGYDPVIVDDLSKSDETLLAGLGQLMGKSPVFYKGSCTDKKFIRDVFHREKISAVLHFAAYKSVGESVERPLAYYENNLNSLLVLLNVMEEFDVHDFVFSSSCTVYGEPDHIPVDETAPFKKAESPYGATKQMCERIMEDATVANKKLKVISLRYFNPIGAHPSGLIGELSIDKPNNLVPFITQTAAGIREKLTIYGGDYDTQDGTCIRDFIHVVDLAKAHLHSLKKLETSNGMNVYNLGTGQGVSVLELVKEFIEATGVDLNYEIGPRRSGDVVKTFANPTKAFKELFWRPQFTIKDALIDAWKWQKSVIASKTKNSL